MSQQTAVDEQLARLKLVVVADVDSYRAVVAAIETLDRLNKCGLRVVNEVAQACGVAAARMVQYGTAIAYVLTPSRRRRQRRRGGSMRQRKHFSKSSKGGWR